MLTGSMTTNGYLLTPSTFDALVRCGVTKFQITIDGLKASHDQNRVLADGSGTYDVIMGNLSKIKESALVFEIDIRHDFDRRSLPKLDIFLQQLAEEFRGDPRFFFGFHAIANLCGAEMRDPDLLPITKGELAVLQARKSILQLGLKEHFTSRAIRPFGSMCYAADPHSFVLATNGDLMKCTVALRSDPRNIIGQLLPNGSLVIDEEKHALWVTSRALSGSSKCRGCWFQPACMGAQCPKEWIERNDCICPSEKLFPREVFDIVLLSKGM